MYRNFHYILLSKFKYVLNQYHRTISKIKIDTIPRNPLPATITVVGACCNVGQISAMLFKTQPIFKRIILYDNVDTSAIAEDLNSINSSATVYSYWGIKKLPDAIIVKIHIWHYF